MLISRNLINSMSKNLRTSFLPLAPEIRNNVNKNKILMEGMNELSFSVLDTLSFWPVAQKINLGH